MNISTAWAWVKALFVKAEPTLKVVAEDAGKAAVAAAITAATKK